MNTHEFIAKAKSIHGDRYSYEKSEYHYRKPITITCKVHGDFQQRYDHHIGPRKSGCRKCYDESLMSTTEKFLTKAKIRHGNNYEYENFQYKGVHVKSSVTCRTHGGFLITPANHLNGGGCPSCKKLKQSNTLQQFIDMANIIHHCKYDYSISVYNGSNKYLKIICKEHGIFEKTPDNHCHKTRPQGCPKCVEYFGYRDTLPGYLYLYRSEDSAYCKIGISNNPRKRFLRLKKVTPFAFQMVNVKKFEKGSQARQCERLIHSKLKSAGFTGFDGCTEWFEWQDDVEILFNTAG